MSRRGARLTVAVLFALVCGAAAWQYVRVERALGSRAEAAATFEREARTLATAVADLRGAQQAYVAAGQGLDFWTTRAARQVASIRARLDFLRHSASVPDAVSRIDAASTALDDFARMDGRAREYAAADQRLLASDLIFGDGFEMTQSIAAAIESARASEAAARAGDVRRVHAEQRLLAGGVSGVGFLFLLVLALAPGTRARAAQKETERVVAEPAPARVLDLTPAPAARRMRQDSPATPLQPSPSVPSVDLSAAAQLCAGLARVTDSEQIPALLARINTVLDAKGIVLWIADPDARELVPTVAHGYPPGSLARLGTIPRDADNATAAAFREEQIHTVKGDLHTSGAIVVPLVTAGGCVGVMAAELRHGCEQREEVRAVASMIAAQLSTLIGVAPMAQPDAKAN